MKRLVIIGGGFVGSLVAKSLENEFRTTLIDSKDCFEYTPSILRTIVEPENIRKIQVPHKDYLKKARIIIGKAQRITDTEVILKKKAIPYDYLVISAGSDYSSPIKHHDLIGAYRAQELKDNHAKIEKSKRILIIGGGLVGVELAAEIVGKYRNKKVTLIHGNDRLVQRNNPKTSRHVEKYLTKRKVNIILDEIVTKIVTGECETNKGRKIEYDIAFTCIGIRPNTKFFWESYPDKVDEKGIRIDEHLMVMRNVFAGGDLVNIKEEKTAQSADKQAKAIIKNILALERGRPLTSYFPKKRAFVISLGKYTGIYEKNNTIITGIIPAMMKKFIERREMRRR